MGTSATADLTVRWTLPGDTAWEYSVPTKVVEDGSRWVVATPDAGRSPWHPDLPAGESVEVERTIGELPEVREVVVVGVDDASFGQRLAAYVVPSEPDAVDPDKVRAHVKARLAGYKVPRDVVLLDELPRNASGKVVVRDLPGPG